MNSGASAASFQLTPTRIAHILDGDATGGGHGPGRNISGKSEFPRPLTDDEIVSGIVTIANDPASFPGGVIPARGPRMRLQGSIRGTATIVIVDPASREIATAYPYGIVRNP